MAPRFGLRLRTRDRDDDVAQITRARFRVGLGGGEGQHIGRRIHTEIVAVEFLQLCVIAQYNGEIAIGGLMSQCSLRGAFDPLQRKPLELSVEIR